MPFICLVRKDIPDGTLRVLDLSPNTSQRNSTLDPPGQTKYVNRVTNDTVTTSGAGPIVTSRQFKGLAAYLLDRVEDADNANIALTAVRANAIAASLISTMDSLAVINLAVVDAAIQAATGGGASTLSGGNSTGSLADVLEILAGAVYVLPPTLVEDAANSFDPTVSGSFSQVRHTYKSGALVISLAEGELAEYTSPSFKYGDTVGVAVVVYDDDGTVLS